MQELGLATLYKERKDIQNFCGMLDGLAFLRVDDVPAGMTFLRNNIPELDNDNQKLADLGQYFNATYVTGSLQRINRADGGRVILRLRRNPPLFPADMWNVYEATLLTGVCTNNACESWNNGFRQLVGRAHPSVWKAIESIQLDKAMTSTALVLFARGQPPAKRVRRETVRYLHNLCSRRRDDDIFL